ncbi:MAG: hypothetical protein R3C56_19450 [Pirellulaceae bacterium]
MHCLGGRNIWSSTELPAACSGGTGVSQAASLTIDTTANNSDGNDRIDINGGTSAHSIADVEIITGTGSDIIYVNGTQTLSGTLTVSSQGDVTGSSSANLDANMHVVGATVDPRVVVRAFSKLAR